MKYMKRAFRFVHSLPVTFFPPERMSVEVNFIVPHCYAAKGNTKMTSVPQRIDSQVYSTAYQYSTSRTGLRCREYSATCRVWVKPCLVS